MTEKRWKIPNILQGRGLKYWDCNVLETCERDGKGANDFAPLHDFQ